MKHAAPTAERDVPERCPSCASDDLKYKPLPGYHPWECADCGHLFDVNDPNLDAYDDEDDEDDVPPGDGS